MRWPLRPSRKFILSPGTDRPGRYTIALATVAVERFIHV